MKTVTSHETVAILFTQSEINRACDWLETLINTGSLTLPEDEYEGAYVRKVLERFQGVVKSTVTSR